jgi:hypothetical protein
MKLVAKFTFSALVLAVGLGCGGGYPYGSVYDGTTIPHGVDREELSGAGKSGDKAGEACATGILRLAAWGDASVDAAKKDGHITEVHSVEFRDMNILGIYMQGCTEVHGK